MAWAAAVRLDAHPCGHVVSPLGGVQLPGRSLSQHSPRSGADILGARSQKLGAHIRGTISRARSNSNAPEDEQHDGLYTTPIPGSYSSAYDELLAHVSRDRRRGFSSMLTDSHPLQQVSASFLSGVLCRLSGPSHTRALRIPHPISPRHLPGCTAWASAGLISPPAPPPSSPPTIQLRQSSISRGTSPELRACKLLRAPECVSPGARRVGLAGSGVNVVVHAGILDTRDARKISNPDNQTSPRTRNCSSSPQRVMAPPAPPFRRGVLLGPVRFRETNLPSKVNAEGRFAGCRRVRKY